MTTSDPTSDEDMDSVQSQHPSVAVENLTKIYNDEILAVDDISFSVDPGDFCIIIGPSGCGKSTTLRSMVGDLTPTSGQIYIDGVNVTDTPTHKRDISLVFQDFQLFPHLNVRENIEYGLKQMGTPPAELDDRVDAIVDLMQLGEFTTSTPEDLSAGEKQRVALARSLVIEPNVLLLDEPLGDLDYKLQKRLERELLDIHHEFDTTFVYVTHDQRQAMRLADQIVVMNDGRIEQSGSTQEIYYEPATAFVAAFVGDSNIFTGEVGSVIEPGIVRMHTTYGKFDISTENLYSDPEALQGESVPFAIRPRLLRIDREGSNQLNCAVDDVIHQPGKGTKLILSVTNSNNQSKQLELKTPDVLNDVGEQVSLSWRPEDAILLERVSVTDNVDLERDILGE